MNQWTKENRSPTIREAIRLVMTQASYNPYKAPGTLECLDLLTDNMDTLSAAPQMYEALEIYADKINWTETARQGVLTGQVRADGYEEETEIELVMHDRVVWDYDGGAGYEIAKAALAAAGGESL